MRRFCLAAALVAVFSVAGACAPAAPVADKDAMIAAASNLDQQFLAAYNAGDGTAMAALYADSPDSVTLPPDAMMLHGITAIRDGLAKMVSTPGAKLELTETHHTALADAVISWGLWKMTMPGPDGQPMVMEGRFSDVKAERNGKWVYLMDHASVPMPAPPAGGI